MSPILFCVLSVISISYGEKHHPQWSCYGKSCTKICNATNSCYDADLICTNDNDRCTFHCTDPGSCEKAHIFSAAKTTEIYCEQQKSCEELNIYCGLPPYLPRGYSNYSVFDGNETDCTVFLYKDNSFSHSYFLCNSENILTDCGIWVDEDTGGLNTTSINCTNHVTTCWLSCNPNHDAICSFESLICNATHCDFGTTTTTTSTSTTTTSTSTSTTSHNKQNQTFWVKYQLILIVICAGVTASGIILFICIKCCCWNKRKMVGLGKAKTDLHRSVNHNANNRSLPSLPTMTTTESGNSLLPFKYDPLDQNSDLLNLNIFTSQ